MCRSGTCTNSSQVQRALVSARYAAWYRGETRVCSFRTWGENRRRGGACRGQMPRVNVTLLKDCGKRTHGRLVPPSRRDSPLGWRAKVIAVLSDSEGEAFARPANARNVGKCPKLETRTHCLNGGSYWQPVRDWSQMGSTNDPSSLVKASATEFQLRSAMPADEWHSSAREDDRDPF